MPTTTGNDRVLSPGTDVVLEVVGVAANEQYSALMPAMYLGLMATDPLPHASLDAISRSLRDYAHNKTLAVNGETFFSVPVFSSGARSSATSVPRPADHGRGQGRVPSQ